MPFQKGKKKTGGRQKGAENKEKKTLRLFLKSVADNNREKFDKELMKLEGEKFINAYLSMMEYCTPKLQRSELVQDTTYNLERLSTEQLQALAEIKTILAE